jgi:hypothetical protein
MNIAIVTGAISGNLVVVDFDSELIARMFFPKLDELIKSTFVVKTSRGYHIYFRLSCPIETTGISFYRPGEKDDKGRAKAYQSVSIKAEGGYVVAPGSLHPSGATYQILNDVEPLHVDDAPEFISKLKRQAKKIAKENEWSLEPNPRVEKDPESTWEYVKLLPKLERLVGDALTRAGGELFGPHPLHGSATGKNFHVNIDRQVWYCFRCQAGGGVLSWLAVKHGLLDCSEAGKIPKKLFPDLYKKIQEEYGIAPPVSEEDKVFKESMITGTKIIEEIWNPETQAPRFVVYDTATNTYEYQQTISEGEQDIYPFPLEPGEERSVGLPQGVMEYGDITTLRKEMLAWALEQYDPVSNGELFEFIVNLSLTSWITDWQEIFAEKFLPIIQAVGPSETGKKRLLTVARYLFYRSVYALKTTKIPSLFRLLAKWRGTLVLDEADLDDSTLSAEFVQYVNSRADGVPVTRFNSEDDTNKWFYSFGYTILAMRKPFADDGAQSRCIKFQTEGTNKPADIDLIPPLEWAKKGEELRQKLMMFRMRHLIKPQVFPTQFSVEGVNSFRAREAVLMLNALSQEDPALMQDLAKITRLQDKRMIEERATSMEGLILNTVYGWINDDDMEAVRHRTGWYLTKTHQSAKSEETWSEPLTLKKLVETFNDSISASELARFWRGLGQQTLDQHRVQGKRFRGILLISNLPRIQKEFRKYVVDAEDVLNRFTQSLEAFDAKSDTRLHTAGTKSYFDDANINGDKA